MVETMMDMKAAVTPAVATVEQSLSQTSIPAGLVKVFSEFVADGEDPSEWAQYELGMAGGNGRQPREESQVFFDQIDKVDWVLFSQIPVKTDEHIRTKFFDALHVCRKTLTMPSDNRWGIATYRQVTGESSSESYGLEPQAAEDVQKYVIGFLKEYYKPEFKQ